MTAAVALAAWIVGSFVFREWKQSAPYPRRSFAVLFTTTLYEVAFVTLALMVLTR